MKKLAIVLIIFSAASFCYAQQEEEQPPFASISKMAGTIELKKSGSSEWIPASAGDTLEKDTIISTGFKSTAILTIGSSVLTVRALTRLSLEEIINQNNRETTNINLNTGRVRVEVTPPSGTRTNLKVQTPSSVASVRGTSFEMDTVKIKVLSGEVGFSSLAGHASRPVTLKAGQESFVNSDTGSVITPMEIENTQRSVSLPGQSAVSAAASARLEFGTLEVNLDGIKINGE